MRTTSIPRTSVLAAMNAKNEAARRAAEAEAARRAEQEEINAAAWAESEKVLAEAVSAIRGILPQIEFDSKWTGKLSDRTRRLTALLGRGPDSVRGSYCPSGGGATTATWKINKYVSLHLQGERSDPYGVGGFQGNMPYFGVNGSLERGRDALGRIEAQHTVSVFFGATPEAAVTEVFQSSLEAWKFASGYRTYDGIVVAVITNGFGKEVDRVESGDPDPFHNDDK
jgi:hypothetical protein